MIEGERERKTDAERERQNISVNPSHALDDCTYGHTTYACTYGLDLG